MVKRAGFTLYRPKDQLFRPGVAARISDFMSDSLGQPIPENIIKWASCTDDGSTYTASIRFGFKQYSIEVFKSAKDDTLSVVDMEVVNTNLA